MEREQATIFRFVPTKMGMLKYAFKGSIWIENKPRLELPLCFTHSSQNSNWDLSRMRQFDYCSLLDENSLQQVQLIMCFICSGPYCPQKLWGLPEGTNHFWKWHFSKQFDHYHHFQKHAKVWFKILPLSNRWTNVKLLRQARGFSLSAGNGCKVLLCKTFRFNLLWPAEKKPVVLKDA